MFVAFHFRVDLCLGLNTGNSRDGKFPGKTGFSGKRDPGKFGPGIPIFWDTFFNKKTKFSLALHSNFHEGFLTIREI